MVSGFANKMPGMSCCKLVSDGDEGSMVRLKKFDYYILFRLLDLQVCFVLSTLPENDFNRVEEEKVPALLGRPGTSFSICQIMSG